MIALASSFLQGGRSFVIGAQTEAHRIPKAGMQMQMQ
jgi:hypothetical protein